MLDSSSPAAPAATLTRHRIGIFATIAIVTAGLITAYALHAFDVQTPIDDDTTIARHQIVAEDSTLRFTLPSDIPLDDATKQLTPPTGVVGTFGRDGTILTFAPTAPLTRGQTYTFVLAGKKDAPISQPLTYTFEVAGPLTATTRQPAPAATDVGPAMHITLGFDRPIVPLGVVSDDTDEPGIPVSITPAVDGRWRWLGTSILTFEPTDGLPLATKFEVNVPAGIVARNGDDTREDFSWDFETARPTVASITPSGDNVAPDTPITIAWNQPVDIESVRAHLRVERIEGEKRTKLDIASVAFGTEKDENGNDIPSKKIVVAKLSAPLHLHAAVETTVDAGVRGATGTLTSQTPMTTRFTTPGDVAVTAVTGIDYGVHIQFSHAVTEDSLIKSLRITPAPKGWDLATVFAEKQKTDETAMTEDEKAAAKKTPRTIASFDEYLPLVPGTTYTATIDATLTDIYGQHLATAHTTTWTTADIPSKLFIENHTGSRFAFFERALPPIFYINHVNVGALNFTLTKLPFTEFLKFERKEITDVTKLGGTETKTWTQKNAAKKNTWVADPLDIAKANGAPLTPGVYALAMTAPEYRYTTDTAMTCGDDGCDEHTVGTPVTDYQFFAVTNVGLTVKYAGDRVLVWAIDTQTGSAMKGAVIAITSAGGEEIARGTSDADGFFETALDPKKIAGDWSRATFWVTAMTADDFAFVSSRWNGSIEPWQFGLSSDFRGADNRSDRVDSYLFTERPIYRPGDTVAFKGIARLRGTDGALRAPDNNQTVEITIRDSDYTEVFKKTYTFSQFGSINGAFKTDEKAKLGDYAIEAHVVGGNVEGYAQMYANFAVQAYRKPEYRVDVTPEKESYFAGDHVRATIDGAYFFGAPMPDAKVAWRARLTDYFFDATANDGRWYRFGLTDSWCFFECSRGQEILTEGTGTLDASGHLIVDIPVDLKDKPTSQVLTIEVDVTDPNNQTVSGAGSVTIHKAARYVGIASETWSVRPGDDIVAHIITFNPDKTIAAKTNVNVKVMSRTWTSVKKKNVDGEFYFDNEPKDTFLRETSVTTDDAGMARVTLPTTTRDGGELRIVATAKDDAGREAIADESVYVWSDSYVNWPHTNNDRIDVVPDKPEYNVGDTAHLIVKSPFEGKNVRALVTVEREGVMTKRVIPVTSNALPIDVPVTDEMVPNAYVSVVIVKARDGETFDDSGRDTGSPAFKIGYAKLLVDTSSRRLAIGIQTDKQKYAPGETVAVTLSAKDTNGKPKKAELSLSVVDLSLLALTGFSLPDLVTNFYAERGLGVVTSEMLTHFVERFKPGTKGGGGSDPEMKKRGDFRDTAYWNPTILTDEKGEARVSFKLPDNLTTWKFLAIGSTLDHLFGAAEIDVVETKHVIIRSVRPRFAVVRDEIEIGAIVHNYLDHKAIFTVSLTGTGWTGRGEMKKTVTIEPEQMTKVTFPITIDPGDKATFTFAAETTGGRDIVEESIPVYAFGTTRSVATSGIVTDIATTETVAIPQKSENVVSGEITATASPTLATYLPAGLDYLMRYPYGCAEQTMSSLLPNIALASLQTFDTFAIVDKKELTDRVTTGLVKIIAYQRPDGGFGYFETSDTSYPHLTAYIVYGLNEIKKAGYAVDAGVMTRAHDYLTAALRDEKTDDRIGEAERAYILFILSETGGVEASLANNLYEKRATLPVIARAQLAMTLHTIGTSDAKTKAASLIRDILSKNVRVDPRGTRIDDGDVGQFRSLMTTSDELQATMLRALIRVTPTDPLIAKLTRYLLTIRTDGRWDTTQSTTTAILAFVDYLKMTNELEGNFTARIDADGENLAKKKFDKTNITTRIKARETLADLAAKATTDVTFTKDGTGRMYYDLAMTYTYAPETIAPTEQGIGITRELTPVGDATKTPTVGNTYRVKLTITVPADRHFVAVESPLPAGFEAINTNFTNVSSELRNETEKKWWSADYWRDQSWRFTHTELRDDRAFLFAEYLPAGVYTYDYLVRATTPGHFRLRPARAFEMYFPEIFGATGGGWFDVATAKETAES